MVLDYYKNRLLSALIQAIFQFRLRRKHYIGKDCFISKDLRIFGQVIIRDGAEVGQNVILNNGVSIGTRSIISNISVGENTQIELGVVCTGNGQGRITIGKESYIGIYNILDWSDNITIGNYVHIAGPSTGLWTHSSAKQCLSSLPLADKNINYRTTAPITIEDSVYVGGNCIIYPGITIHHHSIVAPHSVVDGDIESHTLVGGVPAKIIRKLEPGKESRLI
jgi:acetyltransferase-like isoleucine patch superfamily enzyme